MAENSATRRAFLGTSVVATIGLAGCTGGDGNGDGNGGGNGTDSGSGGDTGEEYDSLDEIETADDIQELNIDPEEVREKAESVEYSDLMRNAEEYVGEAIYYEATVDQVIPLEDEEDAYQLRLFVNDENDDVMGAWRGQRVIEDDVIETYSVGAGRIEYETIFGETREIPLLSIYDIEILEEGGGGGSGNETQS